MILCTFLDEYDLSGKTIAPFNTSGGSGFSGSLDTIAEMETDAEQRLQKDFHLEAVRRKTALIRFQDG